MTTTIIAPFTEDELGAAHEDWGCNCGPSALSFAARLPLEAARAAIADFDSKQYTSPTMMRDALVVLRRPIAIVHAARFVPGRRVDVQPMFSPREREMSLVRIQWGGPWLEPGANPKWAYRYTHWIATWQERGLDWVYDCNGGIQTAVKWIELTAMELSHTAPATGEWFPTHIWRLPTSTGGAR